MLCFPRKNWSISEMPWPNLFLSLRRCPNINGRGMRLIYSNIRISNKYPLMRDELGRFEAGASLRDDLFLGHCMKIKDKELLCLWITYIYCKQWFSLRQQQQHHLGTWEKCKFLSPTPGLLSQNWWGRAQPLCFNKHSRWFEVH